MATYEVNVEEVEPMSRTYQYRKVMKPMLERKRRARINKCLDELKDLMVGALQSEGESITKLEKADVLELTVRHLKKLKQHHALAIPAQNHAHEKFRAGFGHCAAEVRRFVQAVPGVDMHVSARLLNHLGQWMSQMDKISTPTITTGVSPITSPISPPAVVSVSVPKVYTPPASPEMKPSSALPSASSPQPLSLTTKPHSTSPSGSTYPPSTYSTLHFSHPRQPHIQPAHTPPAPQLPPSMPSSNLLLQPTSCSMPSTKAPSPVVTSSSSYNEPLNFSPRPSTGIKVEVPQGSPVWRPWSA